MRSISKYDGRMDAEPEWLMTVRDIAQVDFDLERLNPQGCFARIGSWLSDAAKPLLFWYARAFAPLMRVRGLQLVTRHADVQWVLEHPADFPVHFNPEVREFAGGASTFMLALDGAPHQCQRALVGRWFTDDRNTKFANLTASIARKLLDASGGKIDVMKDYFTRVSAEVGATLLGLEVDDPDAFADWTLAMSNANFADYKGETVARELGSYGAWRQRGVVDRAIAQALADETRARNLLAFLIRPEVLGRDADSIRSVIFGVSVALAPTITIGAGNIMAYLQSDRTALAQCVAAARAGDERRLRALLLEAGRLSPALNPGQFRYVPHDVVLPGGIFGTRRIKAGSTLMVATASALRDRRAISNPGRFHPDRADNEELAWMMFGHGPHICLGAELAMQQLTRLFEELLKRDDIDFAKGRDGKLQRVGPFPRRLFLEFTIPGRPRGQSQIICRIPLRNEPGTDIERLRTAVGALGNPATKHIEDALNAAGVIHFMSMTIIDDPGANGVAHSLILELRAVGDDRHAVVMLVSAIGSELRTVLAGSGYDANTESLVDFLLDRRLDVAIWPWRDTGLHYEGATEFSAHAKDRQADLAAFTRDAVDFYLRFTSGRATRPITTIQFVRSLINGGFDDFRDANELGKVAGAARDELACLKQRGEAFDDLLLIPSRQRLAFVDWRDKSNWDKASDYLGSMLTRPVFYIVTVALLVAAGLMASAIALPPGVAQLAMPVARLQMLAFVIGCVLLTVVAAVSLLLLTVAVSVFFFIRTLRRAELADRPDERDADRDSLRAIAARENAPGYQQNHITAVSDTKVGWFRRLTLSIAMWGIGVLVQNWFRPGFIATMGTIHFASWVRLPGSGKLLFVSNYDGSWDSYLEDFITKVPSGQTAAWTHAMGFPRTRGLIGEGVRDADRFKRWVRRQQRPTDFWYSRRPDLTLDQMRTNALIHDGLARASSDTAARQWLCNFGSAQPTDALLETDEVQTILFRGLPGRAHGAVMLIELPADASDRHRLIAGLLDRHGTPGVPPITFGEMPPGGSNDDSALYLAFSAAGLDRCGVPVLQRPDLLAGFPFPFVEGMRSRARILGDHGVPADDSWNDGNFGGGSVHAVLQLLAKDESVRGRQVEALTERITALNGRVLDSIATDPPDPKKPMRDHFEFRDGISQPVIRGSFGERRALERDRMAPGEFILGYRGNQGYVAPSLQVPIESDRFDWLPDVTVQATSRFPGARQQQEHSAPFRDFGRNGSFFVLRRLKMDVGEFKIGTAASARDLEAAYGGLAATVGATIDASWLAAKMIGRWQDGVPLTARIGPDWGPAAPQPGPPTYEARLSPTDSDFSFARDDPRGLACPLGSHIRRANPRDGLLPDDVEGLGISNRHRIIRRGRSYTGTRHDAAEKGLLFIGLCSDIERQFEFIQQRWVNGSNFHGLANETDPILAPQADGGVFTIPTVAGPVRVRGLASYVTAKGGGYFFLPSRSALRYLATLEPGVAQAASPPRRRPS